MRSPSQNKGRNKGNRGIPGRGASVSRSTGNDTADWPVFRRVGRCVQFCGTLEPGALSSEKHRVKTSIGVVGKPQVTSMCTKTVLRTTPEDRTKKSRIKAWRLAPPRRITSARSAGRRSGNPRFSGNCHHVFRVFVQLVMWRQIWGTDVRFDLLFPLTLTAAMNLAVSTVTWQRNFQFFCKRGE